MRTHYYKYLETYKNKEDRRHLLNWRSPLRIFYAFITLLLTFSVFFISCNKFEEIHTQYSAVKANFNLHLSNVKDITIDHIDIFIFENDKVKAIDTYQRIENVSQSYITCASRSGNKLIVAVANYPCDKEDWKKVNYFSDLTYTISEIKADCSNSPVMSGVCSSAINKNGVYEIELIPIMSKIVLNSIIVDFKGKNGQNENIEDVKIYLTNVNGSCEILKESSFIPKFYINEGRFEKSDYDMMKDPKMIYHSVNGKIGNEIRNLGIELFCYPNEFENEMLGRPATRLVIEGKIKGRTYYYPININTGDFGDENSGKKGVGRNKKYRLDIKLLRYGCTDPESPAILSSTEVKCNIKPWEEKKQRKVSFCIRGSEVSTKSSNPNELLISDLNLFIFNEYGELVEKLFCNKKDFKINEDGNIYCTAKLFKEDSYSIYACANIGYSLNNINTEKQLCAFRYYMAYPDEYRFGIPMTSIKKNVIVGNKNEIELNMVRTMSKICLCIDRTDLDEEVRLKVKKVTIGACPNSAILFAKSRADSEREIFRKGFSKVGFEVDALNAGSNSGESGEIGLFMFENLQGNKKSQLCSFIEVHTEYSSKTKITEEGKNLIYRFYLGEKYNNYDVKRNSEYHFSLKLKGDGLTTNDNWKLDKKHLINKDN